MYIKILEEIFKTIQNDYDKEYVLYKQPYEKTIITLLIYLKNRDHINSLYNIGRKYGCKIFDSESILFVDEKYKYLYSITDVNDYPTLQLNITVNNKNKSFMFLKNINDDKIDDNDYYKMYTDLEKFVRKHL